MTLNATFVVQVLNFLGAWFLVRYLFIQPALRLRDRVSATISALTAERDAVQAAVLVMRDQEYRDWHRWMLNVQRIMKERYQPVAQREPISVRVTTPEVPPQEIEKLTEQLTTLVTKHVQEVS